MPWEVLRCYERQLQAIRVAGMDGERVTCVNKATPPAAYKKKLDKIGRDSAIPSFGRIQRSRTSEWGIGGGAQMQGPTVNDDVTATVANVVRHIE